MKSKRVRRSNIGLIIAVGLTAFLLSLLPSGPARQIPAFLLLWLYPALAWFWLLTGDPSERFVVAAGLVLFINAYLLLLLSFLPGPVYTQFYLTAVVLVTIVPAVASIFLSNDETNGGWFRKKAIVPLALVMLLALLLRIPNIGYKELQGDEGIIMIRAAAVLTGDEAELFLHQKGPMEILLPAATWNLTGSINDTWARLPFAWAGLLSVAAIFLIGRTWFSKEAGIAASVFYAIGGFSIAFSRIVQYQSLVVLWGALSILVAIRYRQKGRLTDLVLSTIFMGAAFLAHYDGLLFAPAVAWLLLGRFIDERRVEWRQALIALLVGSVVVGVFYVPYIMNPNFGRTIGYLLGTRIGLSADELRLGWGGPAAWQMSTFYNSLWYILGLLSLVAVGAWLLAKRRTSFAAILYFAIPAAFYIIVVKDPRTHVYTMYPGAVVLAGLGGVWMWNRVQRSRNVLLRGTVGIVVIIWLVVTALYPFWMFVDVTLERQRSWDAERPSPILYPTSWDEPPVYGLYGFPHQAGWRVIQDTIAEDGLPYGSNEEAEITNWYTSQSSRTHCEDFKTFFLATNTQDPVPYDGAWIDDLYLQTRIVTNSKLGIEVYGRQPVSEVETLEAIEMSRWVRPEEISQPQPDISQSTTVNLGDLVQLIDYEIDETDAHLGGQVVLTLYWQALKPIDRNKQVFVHLNDGALFAQHDGAPDCGARPTTHWEAGQIVRDTHIVPLPDNAPISKIPILVGMYDLLTGERLEISDNPDNVIHLTDVEIKSE